MRFPKIDDVAAELRKINKNDSSDDGDDGGIDVRLQVYPDGDWAVRWGLSDYDQDHRGFWGSGSVPGDNRRFDSKAFARDLIDQAREQKATGGDGDDLDEPRAVRAPGRRVRSDDTKPKEIGHIGDVNWPEYGGGPIYRDADGDCRLEYVEPPEDGVEFGDPDARWTIYRVSLDPEVPDWADLKDVARSADQDPEELAAAFTDDNPLERAWAYETVAGHWGWENFDNYPLTLTRVEMNARYGVDISGGYEEDEDDDEDDEDDEGDD